MGNLITISMETTSSYSLIKIGILIRLLQNVRPADSCGAVIEFFEDLNEKLLKSGLRVSSTGLLQLNEISKSMIEIKKLIKTDLIPETVRLKINTEMLVLEKIVFSEAVNKDIYLIPQRRYNGEFLNKMPQNLLKEGIFGKLSDIAKYDFVAACRCISFGEGTAAAFHILRATEDTLKKFYFKNKKTNRVTKPMWGNMTIDLRNKKTQKVSENILSALDIVRISYRNPTQHPEVTYDIDSAQDLFGVCVDLINKMAEKLEPNFA